MKWQRGEGGGKLQAVITENTGRLLVGKVCTLTRKWTKEKATI